MHRQIMNQLKKSANFVSWAHTELLNHKTKTNHGNSNEPVARGFYIQHSCELTNVCSCISVPVIIIMMINNNNMLLTAAPFYLFIFIYCGSGIITNESIVFITVHLAIVRYIRMVWQTSVLLERLLLERLHMDFTSNHIELSCLSRSLWIDMYKIWICDVVVAHANC